MYDCNYQTGVIPFGIDIGTACEKILKSPILFISMKHLFFIAILLFTFGQLKAQTFKDHKGATSGTVNKEGKIYDNRGALTGNINKSGNVHNKNGTSAGSINDEGKVHDKNGALIGSINNKGKVYNKNGALMGSIDDRGNVYDKNGALMGTARTISKEDAALKFFFFKL